MHTCIHVYLSLYVYTYIHIIGNNFSKLIPIKICFEQTHTNQASTIGNMICLNKFIPTKLQPMKVTIR